MDTESGFRICRIETVLQAKVARRLIEKMYRRRGYHVHPEAGLEALNDRLGLLIHGEDDRALGTLSLQVDSPRGLRADEIYADELDRLRAGGHTVLELGGLALDRHCGNSRRLLAAFSNVAYLLALEMGATYAVIEVNPRHVPYYLDALKMTVLGNERLCPRVGAPAMLMGIDLAYMAQQIRHHGGRGRPLTCGAGGSLYGYFLNDPPYQQAA